MIHFLTYSDENYRDKQERLVNLAYDKFDCIVESRDSLTSTDFYEKNKQILDETRGAGYWLWKPYLIYEHLSLINDGDVLFYLDSGDMFKPELLSDLESIMTDRDYIFTPGAFEQKYYTKGDCFYLMGCNSDKYKNRLQLEAGILVFRKTPKILKFAKEWLEFCRNPQILTDTPNLFLENCPGFVDHRHDQSILTNLVERENFSADPIMRRYVKCNV